MREHLSRYPVMRRALDAAAAAAWPLSSRANRPAATAPQRLDGWSMDVCICYYTDVHGWRLSWRAFVSRQRRLSYITTFGIFRSLSSDPSVQPQRLHAVCVCIDCLEAVTGRLSYIDKHNIPFATASYILRVTSSSITCSCSPIDIFV